MRIAYISATMRVGQDGVTRCVYRSIEGARVRGHEVIALTSAPPDGEVSVDTVSVPSLPIPLQRTYRLAVPGSAAIPRSLESFAPDIVHVHSPCTLGYAAMQWARRNGVPAVATYHTHFPTYPRYYGMRGFEELAWKLVRRFYNAADLTLVPTRPVLEELRDNRVQHAVYMSNGVDLGRFDPAFHSSAWRAALGGEESDPVLLFVSRLVWEKDLRILADAYSRLRARGLRFRCAVVGDGPARSELEALMPGAVFLGYRAGDELAAAFASSDIFVFPSTTETFGLVTLEAMASGLPPVAAAQGGALELIEHGRNGLLAAPRDAQDLARHVETLLVDASARKALARAAYESARSYDWESILDRTFAIFADLVRSARPVRRRAA